jgi:hypothetical protein
MATTTTTTLPTGWADQAAYGNFQQALQASQRPYERYPGQTIAGWDPGQAGAYNAIMNGSGVGLGAMQDAQGAATYAAKWGPQQVAAQGYQPWMQGWNDTATASAGPAWQMGPAQMGRGEVGNVLAGQFPGANLGAYMNPFQSSVIDTTMGQLGRQNDLIQNQTRARTAAAGAFGGNRGTLAESENNRAFLDTAGRTIAGLNQANFGQAQAAIQADQNRDLTAQQSNQAQDWNVGSANLAARQQSGLQNMLAGNEMARYNATNQQGAYTESARARNAALAAQAEAGNKAGAFNSDLNLRGQLANQSAAQNAVNTNLDAARALSGMSLDEQRRAFNAAQAQWTMGGQRQAFDQSVLNEQQKNWMDQRNYPLTQLDILQKGLNGAQAGTAKSEPYYPNTAANILSGGLGGAQLLGQLPSAITGAKSAYDSLGSAYNYMFGNGSAMPNSIYDAGASSAQDLLSNFLSGWK